MLNVIIAVLTVAYILVAFVGPLAALGLSVYWAYQSMQTGGGFGGAVVTFLVSGLVLMVALMLAKSLLKWVMNKVDLGEEADAVSAGELSGQD